MLENRCTTPCLGCTFVAVGHLWWRPTFGSTTKPEVEDTRMENGSMNVSESRILVIFISYNSIHVREGWLEDCFHISHTLCAALVSIIDYKTSLNRHCRPYSIPR